MYIFAYANIHPSISTILKHKQFIEVLLTSFAIFLIRFQINQSSDAGFDFITDVNGDQVSGIS